MTNDLFCFIGAFANAIHFSNLMTVSVATPPTACNGLRTTSARTSGGRIDARGAVGGENDSSLIAASFEA